MWRTVCGETARLVGSGLSRSHRWSRTRFLTTAKPGHFPPDFSPLPLLALSDSRPVKVAVRDQLGTHTHGDLLSRALALKDRLIESIRNTEGSAGGQVAILVPNDHRYVVCQWAAWLAALCVVPLHHSSPEALLKYYIEDSQSKLVIVSEDLEDNVSGLQLDKQQLIVIPERLEEVKSVSVRAKPEASDKAKIRAKWKHRDAQIVYTSGTTGPPKGVVATHSQLHVQAAAVAHEWLLDSDDTVLHHLPLHHTHGIVNGLLAPLLAQAKVLMLPKFSPESVWEELLREDGTANVLMGVPTMYAKLISFAKEKFPDKIPIIRDFLRVKLKLCTCGSASLPDSILKDWQDLSGHMLLERYGMSEFGMALGNPLAEHERKVGFVGRPFPGIRVRISRRDAYTRGGYKTMLEGDKYSIKKIEYDREESGDLLVKGPQVFSSYFNRPEETKKSFTDDGWFITGDIAKFDGEAFKILGRNSVDIIKSGGFKISALDVERVLLQHPGISEAVVVGIPDMLYGEKIVAIIVASKDVTLEDVQKFSLKFLSKSSIPTKIVTVESIPRNALGKVNKAELKKELFSNQVVDTPRSYNVF